jgi:hypothetical protein
MNGLTYEASMNPVNSWRSEQRILNATFRLPVDIARKTLTYQRECN